MRYCGSGGANTGADGKPLGGSRSASPEAASPSGAKGGIAFARKRGSFGFFVGQVALGRG
jgi:hypothetical protein